MRSARPTILLLVLLALPLARVGADDRPEKQPGVVTDVPGGLVFDADPHQGFPDTYQHHDVAAVFTARNRGTSPVRIEQALAVRGTAEIRAEPELVAPGGELTIRVRQPLGAALGMSAFRYALVTDEPGVSRYRFSLTGFVQSAYDPEQLLLDLGFVDRSRGGRASAELFSREVDRLEVLGADGGHPSVRVETARAGVAEEGLVVTAVLLPGAPVGSLTGTIGLATNVVHQPRLEIRYSAQVFGELVPSEHPIALGLIRASEHASRDVTLRSRSGRPFTITAIAGGEPWLATDAAPCSGDGPSDCWVVRLTCEVAEPATLGGTLHVATDLDGEVVPLAFGGIVVDRGTEIRTLEVPDPSAGSSAGERR